MKNIGIIMFCCILLICKQEVYATNNTDMLTLVNSFKKINEAQLATLDKLNNTFFIKLDEESYAFPENLDIVTLGDSLTAGVGDESKSEGYVGYIDDKFNKTKKHSKITNFGISGYRSDQLLKKTKEKDVIKAIKSADLIIMTIGANDLMKIFKKHVSDLQVEPFFNEMNSYEKRLDSIFKSIKKSNPNAKIYLLGFYNPFAEYFADIDELNYISSSWNASSAMVAVKNKNVHFIPTADLFTDNTNSLLAEDNFHPNKKGYTKIAKEVIEHIQFGVDEAYDTK